MLVVNNPPLSGHQRYFTSDRPIIRRDSPMARGLLGVWPLNNGNKSDEFTTNSWNVSVAGTTRVQNRHDVKSWRGNATASDLITYPNSSTLRPTTGTIIASIIQDKNKGSGSSRLLFENIDSAFKNGWGIINNSSGTWFAQCKNAAGTTVAQASATANIGDNLIHVIAFTWTQSSGSTQAIMTDGKDYNAVLSSASYTTASTGIRQYKSANAFWGYPYAQIWDVRIYTGNVLGFLAPYMQDIELWTRLYERDTPPRIFVKLPSVTSHSLTADNITTGAPTLDTPTIAQVHALTANDILVVNVTGPTLGQPTITQVHALTADGVTTGAPTLGTPTLIEVVVLSPDDITTGVPTLDAPTIAQLQILAADGVTTGTPVLDTPTITQLHALAADGITTGASILDTPTLGTSGNLEANDIVVGTPVLDAPTVAQVHILTANNILAGVPQLTLAVLDGNFGGTPDKFWIRRRRRR